MSRPTESALGYLLCLLIGIAGCFVLTHWAACEQSDSFCAFTGEDSK